MKIINDIKIKKMKLTNRIKSLHEEIIRLKKENIELKKKVFKENNSNIIKILPDIVYRIDIDGNFIFINEAVKTLNYSPEELLGKHFSILIHPDDRKKISRSAVLPEFLGKKTGDIMSPKLFDERRGYPRHTKKLKVKIIPKKISDRSGNNIFYYAEVSSVRLFDEFDPQKNFLGTTGIIRDITKERLAEEKLNRINANLENLINERTDKLRQINIKLTEESAQRKKIAESYLREKLRVDKIIELNPYAISESDGKGYGKRVNKAFKELFGSAPPPDYVIFEDPFLKKLGLIDRVSEVKKGKTVKFSEIWFNAREINPLLPDKEVCVSLVLFPIYDENKKIENIIFMYEDVTERKILQKEILNLSDRIQNEIGQELHDVICQNLYGISIGIQRISKKNNDDSLNNDFNKLINLINDSISETRRLSRGLSFLGVEKNGICCAVSEISESYSSRYNLNVNFLNKVGNIDLKPDFAIQIYRIIQEALINAVKHSYCRKIDIILSKKNNMYQFIVKDDGNGFTLKTSNGIGTLIMKYRASIINASIDIETKNSIGTAVICTFAL